VYDSKTNIQQTLVLPLKTLQLSLFCLFSAVAISSSVCQHKKTHKRDVYSALSRTAINIIAVITFKNDPANVAACCVEAVPICVATLFLLSWKKTQNKLFAAVSEKGIFIFFLLI
jgi:hypothetical protein